MDKLTEMGNAEALIEQFGEDLRYCPQTKEWYIWDGRRWKEDIGKSIIQMAKDVARSFATKADQHDHNHPTYKALIKWGNTSESLRGLQSMILLAQSNENTLIDFGSFDCNPNLIYLENGVIDLDTHEFRGFDRHDHVTKLAPVVFRRDAVSTKWERFLMDILPDPDTRDFIQRAIGYSLTGHTQEEVMFILYGTGQNGKTTFTSAILNMLGEYGAQASSSALIHHDKSGPSNELYVLIGRRFVVASETGESKRLDESLVKQMTGMDRISVNPKYKSQIEFTPTWKIWLSTNHEPIVVGNDHAMWRRLRKVPFDVVIPESKRDPKLKLSLLYDLDERSGILNWALEGVRRWQEDGLKPSKQVYEATRTYRADQDLVGQFITEKCHVHPSLRIQKGKLYRAYLEHCKEMNEDAKTKMAFGYQLRERGIRDDRDRNARYWVGIGIDVRVNLLGD